MVQASSRGPVASPSTDGCSGVAEVLGADGVDGLGVGGEVAGDGVAVGVCTPDVSGGEVAGDGVAGGVDPPEVSGGVVVCVSDGVGVGWARAV
ncbi:hypothetical protein [Streptomyces albogriseolus]|uniref:hypothetical protein n=1 Tax=Streptomyces albogriseolus TaxID=1887 RepID=UPI003F4A4A42